MMADIKVQAKKNNKFKSQMKPKKYAGKKNILKTKNDDSKKKYIRGKGLLKNRIETKYFKSKYVTKERNIRYAAEQAVRTETLLCEESGYIEADEGESTLDISQSEILDHVDISAASKSFNLNLDNFGPYKIDYTRNGRHLLLGGSKGHIAALDWVTKKLFCEFNVMEGIHAISWLHMETMFAVAQKNWVHIYDNSGVELHCIKHMKSTNVLEFLPYHFLLVGGTNNGYLKWLDVSIGEIVSEYRSNTDNIKVMAQNPSNAVICVGNSKGVVSMHSPSVKTPLAKILCHPSSITAVGFNPSGTRMVTAGVDRRVCIWDTRMMTLPMFKISTRSPSINVCLSQKNTLAIEHGNICNIYKNTNTGNITSYLPYLKHNETSQITDMTFVPFEDVLGIGKATGFSSILVPGAGEANFDALETNPFISKKQSMEHEVKTLLEKIPSELITLDTKQIVSVDLNHLQKKLNEKPKLNIKLHNTPMKKKNISGIRKNKQKQTILNQKAQIHKTEKILANKMMKTKSEKQLNDNDNVLDRFKIKRGVNR